MSSRLTSRGCEISVACCEAHPEKCNRGTRYPDKHTLHLARDEAVAGEQMLDIDPRLCQLRGQALQLHLGISLRAGGHLLAAEDWDAILDFADLHLRQRKITRPVDQLPAANLLH